jgi:hypothetical protein
VPAIAGSEEENRLQLSGNVPEAMEKYRALAQYQL